MFDIDFINKYCKSCNKETCHDYITIDMTVTKNNPTVVVECEICGAERYITEKDWVANSSFLDCVAKEELI